MDSGGWAGLSVVLLMFAAPWAADLELHRTDVHRQPVDISTRGCLGVLLRYLFMVGALASGAMAVAEGLGLT